MKKRGLWMSLAAAVFLAAAVPVCAAPSPTGKPVEGKGEEKAPVAPRTGDSSLVIYEAAAVLFLGGAAVSAKKLKDTERMGRADD